MAREWLWALGCVLVMVAVDVLVISNSVGGSTSGPLNIPASAWAQFGDTFNFYGIMPGHGGGFWYWVLGLYGAVQLVRVTTWAVRQFR